MTAREGFEWNEQFPEKVIVYDATPEGHATPFFGIVLDYGWAERICCSGCYQQDAEAIASAIREVCGIPEPAS